MTERTVLVEGIHYRPLDDCIDEVRSKLAADPDNQEAQRDLASYERIKEMYDKYIPGWIKAKAEEEAAN